MKKSVLLLASFAGLVACFGEKKEQLADASAQTTETCPAEAAATEPAAPAAAAPTTESAPTADASAQPAAQ